jgi:hypothetical protein
MLIEHKTTEMISTVGRNSSGEWEGMYWSNRPDGGGWEVVRRFNDPDGRPHTLWRRLSAEDKAAKAAP